MNTKQKQRTAWRIGFFVVFLVAPILDIFRLDLYLGHFIIFGQNWQLGIYGVSANEAVFNIITRAFLPIALVVGVGGTIAWRWGRLYCGWLCPHYSVVEIINDLMRRASGKTTLWLKKQMPEQQSDGFEMHPNKAWWPLVALAVVFFAALWAISLLTYLLPPKEIWGNLFHGELTRNQFVFIAVATTLFTLEFTLARHLFCRFGCAIGLAQSLIWMGNSKAMVVGFDRSRAAACASCDKSCELACPMQLKPRQIKRKMFSCTQCQACVQACERVTGPSGQPSLLKMLDGDAALQVSRRDFGYRPRVPKDSFSANDGPIEVVPLNWVEK